ncbi:MAG: BatD family protein [Leptospiraceae bacterium]|nr:BatD family protein [Leptospiraceae bacterium]MCP5494838.1 BatD family protein [Leptospiraceae bacterium]
MKYFGNLFLFILLLIPISIFGEIKFSLSKTVIDKGEPLYAYFEIDGSPEIEISRKVVTQNGVTAEYIGQEDNITAKNFEVSRKKIIKFRILSTKPGTHQIPNIQIMVDGKQVQSQDQSFEVTNQRYNPPQANKRGFDSIFDQFFSEDAFAFQSPFMERGYVTPEEDDLLIRFETSKSTIYVGETIVGYFILHYRNMNKPFFGRNQVVNLDFPYFVSELLHDVNITLPAKTDWKGSTYFLDPYNKEVYALTALKKGIYKIGEAKFEAEGNIASYFPPMPLDSGTKTIEVLELPNPKPQNFSKEVGDYDISISIDNTETKQNDSISLTVTISGEGTGALFKNPLGNYCQNGTDCNISITLINEHKTKKFAKLKNGDYGFTSESTFYYSLYPKKTGKLHLPDIKVTYFNPNTQVYETKTKQVPVINVSPKEKKEDPKNIIPDITQYTKYATFGALFLFGVLIIFVFRHKIQMLVDYVLEQTNSFIAQSPSELEYIDRIIGNKKGTLLKNYFLEKGWNRYRVNELVDIKSHYQNASLVSIYKQLDGKRKKYLLNMVKELVGEEKL